MDKREAQFILSAYRPNGRDAGDDRIAAARSLVESDPDLKAWFESEVRQDQVIANKLRQVQPPAGLRDQILTGMSLAEATPPWWRRAPALAQARECGAGTGGWSMRCGQVCSGVVTRRRGAGRRCRGRRMQTVADERCQDTWAGDRVWMG